MPPADTLRERAEDIASQYLADVPPTYIGRYSEIADPQTVASLLEAYELGLKPDAAARAAGLHPKTVQRWKDHAETQPNSAYASFVLELENARYRGQKALLAKIQKAGEKPQFWTANAWMLERTDPEQFALRKDDSRGTQIMISVGGVRDSEVQVNVIANYQTHTESEGQQTQALTAPIDAVCIAKGEGESV